MVPCGDVQPQDVGTGPSAERNEILQVRKAAVDHVLSRYRTGCRRRSYKPARLDNQQKRSVLSVVNLGDKDRSSERGSKLVLVIRRHRLAIAEEGVCVEFSVSEVLPEVSV